MKRFLFKSIVFLMPVIIIYMAAYQRGYCPILTDSISFDAKLMEIKRLKLKQVDIMAIGSSICLNNLNSAVVKDSLAFSYYNFGAWGLQMADLNQLIKSYVANYQPKYILLPSNFSDFALSGNQTLPDHLFFSLHLTPLYYIKNFTNYQDIKERKRQLSFYQANERDFNYLTFDHYGGISLNVSQQNADKERLVFIDHLLAIFPNPQTSHAYHQLDSLATFLAEKKIKLIFIQYPYASGYIKTNQKQKAVFQHIKTCQTIIENHGGFYLNYAQTGVYPDSLFADPLHLNERGAALVTKKIISKLRAIIAKDVND